MTGFLHRDAEGIREDGRHWRGGTDVRAHGQRSRPEAGCCCSQLVARCLREERRSQEGGGGFGTGEQFEVYVPPLTDLVGELVGGLVGWLVGWSACLVFLFLQVLVVWLLGATFRTFFFVGLCSLFYCDG